MLRILLPLLIFLSASASFVQAQNNSLKIPSELENWQDWATFDYKEQHCPFLYNNKTTECIWSEALKLNANDTGITFSQTLHAYKDSWAAIIGERKAWPSNITNNNKAAIIRDLNGTPEIFLEKGKHLIEGRINWNKLPRQLQLPSSTAITQLTLNNNRIAQPYIDTKNQIWLNRAPENIKKSQDSIQIKVFRLIDDTLPLQITTQLMLDIAGSERELQLGQLLLNDFIPMQFRSELPARIEDNGDLRIQVKPGQWIIELQARHPSSINQLSYQASSELWPQQEIWAFRAAPLRRQVQIKGATAIDPQQTQLPANWRMLPSYLITPETQFSLMEQYRGDSKATSNHLSIERDIWLDFEGNGFTTRDNIQGTMNNTWRLNAQSGYQLGRVSVNGEPQMITQLNDHQGVEIRQHNLSLEAVSRHKRSSELGATGWQSEIDQLEARLHLAPGWSLIASQGSDYARGSWLSKWNLWDIFLLLIIAVAAFRLAGPALGVALLFTLVLTYQRDGAPLFIWLNLTALLAVSSIVKGVWQKRLLYYSYFSFALLIIISIPFAIDNIRQAVYPQLEHANRAIHQQHQEYPHKAQEEVSYDSSDLMMSSAMESVAPSPSRKMSNASGYSKPDLSQQYDPNRRVQTGPGIPNWRWNSITIGWNGPVTAEQTLQLTIAPPWLNRLGNIASVLMILLTALLLFSRLHKCPTSLSGIGRTRPASTATALVLLFGFAGYSPSPVAEVLIDTELLKTLQQRLLQPAQCLPSCASIESGSININDDQLSIKLLVHAASNIALPLPLPKDSWQPQSVFANQKSAALLRNARKQWLINLDKGQHNIEIKGRLEHINQLSLPFQLSAHNIKTRAQAWQIDGIENNTISGKNLKLTRRQISANNSEQLQAAPSPAFVTVTRTLMLGLDWRVETTVERVVPAQGAIHLSIPLLEQESPLNAGLAINNRQVKVSLQGNQRQFSWTSMLNQTSDTLQLKAPEQNQWAEIWVLQSSPIWHTQSSGLAPIKSNRESPNQMWQPWPEETLSISVIRPSAIDGTELTIDNVNYLQTMGLRSYSGDLNMTVRASQGSEFNLPLPISATLQQLLIDDVSQPLNQTQGDIKIPLHPGKQTISAQWQVPHTLSLVSNTPALALGNSSNNNISISLPSDRWPLLVGGPAIGPAVLLWGMLIVILLLSAMLGRLQQTPLKTWHWLLLGIGMGTANLFAPLIIVAWLLALGFRGQLQTRPKENHFALMQTGLLILSAIALLCLLGTIPYGLLASPDMHIQGNGSSAYQLKWYQDLSDGALAEAWVISLPMWAYRLAMLAWSLWMSLALIRWLGWGWKQYSHLGVWPEKKTPKAKAASTASKKEIKMDLNLPD